MRFWLRSVKGSARKRCWDGQLFPGACRRLACIQRSVCRPVDSAGEKRGLEALPFVPRSVTRPGYSRSQIGQGPGSVSDNCGGFLFRNAERDSHGYPPLLQQ